MMDLGIFKDFLTNLSRVSSLVFYVTDRHGVLFTAGDRNRKRPSLREVQSLSGKIIERGTSQHDAFAGKYEIIGMPLKNGDDIKGALTAHPLVNHHDSQTIELHSRKTPAAIDIETLLGSLAQLMEDQWVTQKEAQEITHELMQSFEDLHLYSRIATQIKTLRFSSNMLRDLTEELLETMRADLAFAKLPERHDYDALILKEGINENISDINAFVNGLLDSISVKDLSFEDDYFIVNDSRETPEYMNLHPHPYRFLAVRIGQNEKLFGWLGLVSFNLQEVFRRSELRLLSSMAEQLAAVLTNTDLYNDLEQFVINMVKSLVYAIEAKDVYTRGHSERVSRYSMKIADRLGLQKEQRNIVHWASILHDVGKIGIPEKILDKPGPLNDEEFEIIKKHPEKGYNILQPLEQLSASLPGILHHHERYDGSGYPHGLSGEEIPLSGRIIAVADTFDAITSHRPYRPGKKQQEALAIIEAVAGTQLDPNLAKLFIEIIREESEMPEHTMYAGAAES